MSRVKSLMGWFDFFLRDNVPLEVLTPQNALLGFTNDSAIHDIVNHILLIFKIFLYKYRSKNPTFMLLLSKIKNVIEVEKRLCFSDRRRFKFHSKWSKILDIIWLPSHLHVCYSFCLFILIVWGFCLDICFSFQWLC